jgi:hypothetical protein
VRALRDDPNSTVNVVTITRASIDATAAFYATEAAGAGWVDVVVVCSTIDIVQIGGRKQIED